MASPLLSYAEAAEQVHLFLLALAEGRKIPIDPHGDPAGLLEPDGNTLEARSELVPLAGSTGRVLASAIRADRDLPPFPRSTRDGFACRATEASTNQLLFVAGHIRAGQDPGTIGSGALGSGEVWEIMTGAPVPEGADAVFMVEHSEHSASAAAPASGAAPDFVRPDFVRLVAPRTLQPGENIVPRGAEAHSGDVLVPPGVRVGAAQIALAAQCGYTHLAVLPRPRVAILSTGDELVPVEATPGPSQIRNSNSPMLAALVAGAGGDAIVLPAIPDREDALDEAIRLALPADLLLITGGISMGRFDLVEDALTRAGARFFFGGVAIQPGKPVVFGQLPRHGARALPFFALPGNPISSAVTFHLFAAPLLAALGGDSGPQPRFALAHLAGEWRGKPGLTRFLPGSCDFMAGIEVRLVPWQGSGDLAAFARSNCFIVVPAEASEIAEGSAIQILLT
jgi:molybdopterin molybdotransferase